MKNLSLFACLCSIFILASCSDNEEPAYSVFMQPSSIIASDGTTRTFEYDEYGRIITWTLRNDDKDYCTAHYSYPDANTIIVKAEEISNSVERYFDEIIQLINGRATKSEGTFISYGFGNLQARKSYRLEFSYNPANQLNVVKHAEVLGIGDEIKDGAWDTAWSWENYLIWQDGNLKEYQNYNGNSSLYQTSKFEYSTNTAEYPLLTPIVINNIHHTLLVMQGVFGQNCANLVKSTTVFDSAGNLSLSRQYTYELEDGLISKYTQTTSDPSGYSRTTAYIVNWSER